MTQAAQTKVLVSFWGTRGSISTPGRATEKYGGNTPCISVQAGDKVIVFDAGTGIRNLGLSLVEESQAANGLDMHLFLSHTHWDHIQGLPFFGPAYIPGNKLAIYGSPSRGKLLTAILQGQMDSQYFPVDMSAFQAKIAVHEISEGGLQLGPVRLDWLDHNLHPGRSVLYSVQAGNRRFVYGTDVELNKVFNEFGEPSGLDDQAANDYLKFVAGADLLIADGQYTQEEYATHKGWGHSSVPVLLRVAAKADVKRLAVFHHDPQHSDKFIDDVWEKHTKLIQQLSAHMNVFWAREGMTLTI